MAFHHSPRIVTNGLVLCLDAGSRKSYGGSGTIWRDLVGGNNGGLVNGPTFNSANGGSIVFDGVDDYASFNTPSSITLTTPQTWEVWCSVIRITDWGYIIHNNSTAETIGSSFLTIGIETTDVYFATFNKLDRIISNIVPSLNQTNQIVLIWDGLNQSMYINGLFQGSKSLTTLSALDTITSIASTYRVPTYRPVKGNIANVKVYNRALSATEVLQNYNALKGRFGL